MSAPKPRRFTLKEVLEMPLSTQGSEDKLLLETEVSAYYGEAIREAVKALERIAEGAGIDAWEELVDLNRDDMQEIARNAATSLRSKVEPS